MAWSDPRQTPAAAPHPGPDAAGFPSGEAYKVGRKRPYLRLPRAFVRQTLDVGAADEAVEGSADQLAGWHSTDRWVLTIGKFAVTDVFDGNPYAHDPRGDFLNWAAVESGSFDYAAEAWGYSVGAAAERYRGPWAVARRGVRSVGHSEQRTSGTRLS